ncbi:MAG: glycosyltransferase family 2 protein [Gammaproteobacteria bacterium]|nr:glycosyltransferase family 2 protein [Gammaproteobacteria bacterium]MBQ0838664.1 glycosyltransferase family 2 protein [Gammaproteobacteria bacterium]
MGPLISIIMPCYNRADTIATSIESVLAQSFTDWELVIVDDGSTDGSAEITQSFNDRRIKLHTQKNSGVCRARNAGIDHAQGSLIAFLDTDDTWHPDYLSQLHGALTNSDATLVYCGWQNIGLAGGQGEPFVPPDYETPKKLELLFQNCRWPIHACLTYKTAIIEAGLFNESILTSEDYLLWLNIAIKHPLTRVPEVLAYYHFHAGEQATQDKAKIAINHCLAQRLFLSQHPEAITTLGASQVRQLMYGELLKQGFACYWNRDLRNARSIFKQVMKCGYGNFDDWKYMLPSLLPYSLHRKLITAVSAK